PARTRVSVPDFKWPQSLGLGIDIPSALRHSFLQFSLKPLSPAKNVIPHNPVVQRRHAQAPFLLLKSERTLDRGRGAFCIKALNKERLTHFGRGARKFAQYQHSITIRLAGNI